MTRTRRSAIAAAATVAYDGPSEYELDIERKRAANKALLEQLKSDCTNLGVLLPKAAPKAAPKAQQPERKRKAREPAQPSRRSLRVSKKVADLQELDSEYDSDEPVKKRKAISPKRPSMQKGSNEEERPPAAPRVNGKIFGMIEGIEVGHWWQYRDECGRDGVHAPTVAGIYGGSEEGAYSVAVSAGYPEDLDLGDTFTYTGSGGRELKKKNLRTAPQSSDQVLTRGNAALHRSFETGNPVRVIRGYKAAMGPLTGYRYDGLYKVVRSYTTLNSEGKYRVYKFDFQRLPGQPPVDYGAKERTLAEQEVEAAAAAEAAAEAAANAPPTPPSSEVPS